MKRISVSLLAVAISAAAVSAIAVAQDSSVEYSTADSPHSDVVQVVPVDENGNQNGPSSYQREQCWNEQTSAYDDGYYRDGSGRLYRGDGRTNTSGVLIGALVGGAIGNTVGKGDGRTAATVAGAVIGGSIGAHADMDNNDYQYRDDTSGVVRRCRTVTVIDNGNTSYPSNQYPSSYQREQCWNEQTSAYDDGYYRDGSGRLYRGDGRTNTSGVLIGALVGGAIGNTVGKGDGRTAATIAGAVIGGSIGAHADMDNNDYQYRDDTSGVVRRCRTVTVTNNGDTYQTNQYPSSYEREQCWNEQTSAYDDGYYRDGSGRLYRGDGRTNTDGVLIGALVGGALGNTVGKGDGRTAATVAGAVIGGSIGAHADMDNNDYQYRDDTSGIVRRCRTVTVIDNGNTYPSNQYPSSYQRQQCWNEQTSAYDDGYYRDGSGRLYRGDGRTNTSGVLIGALVGGALGNTVGKGDGRTAATVAGAVIGGAIGAHADDSNDYQYRDDTSGVVRRCRTVTVTVSDNGNGN